MTTLNDISSEGILPLTVKHGEVYGVDIYFVKDLVWFYTGLGPVFYEADKIELLRTFISDSIATGKYIADHGKLVWDGPTTYSDFLKTV
jgi:hypothetical protein